jgi:hypothetical protein
MLNDSAARFTIISRKRKLTIRSKSNQGEKTYGNNLVGISSQLEKKATHKETFVLSLESW